MHAPMHAVAMHTRASLQPVVKLFLDTVANDLSSPQPADRSVSASICLPIRNAAHSHQLRSTDNTVCLPACLPPRIAARQNGTRAIKCLLNTASHKKAHSGPQAVSIPWFLHIADSRCVPTHSDPAGFCLLAGCVVVLSSPPCSRSDIFFSFSDFCITR